MALIRTLAEEPTLKPFCQRSFSLELLFILAEAERTRQELGVEECFEALTVARPTRGTFFRCYQSLVEEGAWRLERFRESAPSAPFVCRQRLRPRSAGR